MLSKFFNRWIRQGKRMKAARASRNHSGSIPVSGVVSGVPAGKSKKQARRDADPHTRDACAPRKKSLARWVFRFIDGNGFIAFALRGPA